MMTSLDKKRIIAAVLNGVAVIAVGVAAVLEGTKASTKRGR